MIGAGTGSEVGAGAETWLSLADVRVGGFLTGVTRLLALVIFKVILRAGGVEVEPEAKVEAGDAGVEGSEGV